ncbi:mas-related G-protein coupled receptor member D-like [Pyrgilauda ruficollis]|uniref:mas-related G-protein coupled receptor member D-like n=1 Tax=Pyrgilauda ruficollis TaxID=221976 RepID=UPI001B87B7CF|nr:mas-related G-protein coupled receptor member D-like [Pyrgilauda ruficollis]
MLTTSRGHIPLPAQCPSMEVTTVSTFFTSPNDGPGQCEINVSSMAMHFVTLLIGLCGLAGNGTFLWLLLIDAITDFVAFNQASIDFLFLIFMVPSTLLFLVEEVSCSALISPMYLSLLSQLSLFTYTMGLFQLMFISIERCRSILCLFFCVGQQSEQLLWVVMSALFWALFFVVTAVNPTVTSLCQSHEQEKCQVALTSMYALNLFLFAVPMVISCTILFIHFKPGSQEPPKNLDIVIFLVALFSLPLSLWLFLQQLGYTAVPSQVVFLLTCITSSIKPFIYFLVGSWKRAYSMRSCWRLCSMQSCRRHSSMQSLRKAIHRVFEEPRENTACGDDPAVDTEASAC